MKGHNYCRSFKGKSDFLWCYTTDPKKRWEKCEPLPEENMVILDKAHGYKKGDQ